MPAPVAPVKGLLKKIKGAIKGGVIPANNAPKTTILQGRGLALSIGTKGSEGINIEGIHMDVTIKRTMEGSVLDFATIDLINTSKPCIDLIMKSVDPVYIQIRAWYNSVNPGGSTGYVFTGEIRHPIKFSHENFVDTHLKFEAVDGYDMLAKKKYSGSLPAGTTYMAILEDVLQKSATPVTKDEAAEGETEGGGIPSIIKAIPTTPEIKITPSTIGAGVRELLALRIKKDAWVESGTFTDVLNNLCKVNKLHWTVQNGQVRIVLKKDRFQFNFYKLDTNTLVEPVVEEKNSKSSLVLYKCRSFYLADLLPGDYIAVNNSRFLVTELEHVLSNHEDNFHTQLVMEELEGGKKLPEVEIEKVISQADVIKSKEDKRKEKEDGKKRAKVAQKKASVVN